MNRQIRKQKLRYKAKGNCPQASGRLNEGGSEEGIERGNNRGIQEVVRKGMRE